MASLPAPPFELPPLSDTKRWKAFCFGEKRSGGGAVSAEQPSVSPAGPADAGHAGEEAEEDGDVEEDVVVEEEDLVVEGEEASAGPLHSEGVPPFLSVLVSLDHVSSLKLLSRHISRVCSCGGVPPLAYMLWLYGLLARVDLPLDPDTAAQIRTLLRYCCRQRAGVCARAGEVTEGGAHTPGPAHQELAPLNVVIAIIHRVFGQLE